MDKPLMAAIIKARALQLYYHYCHNLVSGPAFFTDHTFFADSYTALDKNYDQLVEYFIALLGKEKYKTKQVTELLEEELEDLEVSEMTAEEMYKEALAQEAAFQKYLTSVNKVAPLGLQNTVQGMATESDVRLYKIRQRLAGK